MWNPKFKDFLEDNKDMTILGLAWACYWRITTIVIVIIYVVAILERLFD